MKLLNKEEVKDYLSKAEVDTFISCASFENRCLNICGLLNFISFKQIILFGTIDFHEEITVNRDKMGGLFTSSSNVSYVDLKINDPAFSFVNIANACSQLFMSDLPQKILLDVTTFTHEGLLMIYRVLDSLKREQDKVVLFYMGAKEYSYDESDQSSKWLSKGVKDLRSIIGYPGYSDPSKKNHLIILVGFEVERTIQVIDKFDFDLVSLSFGSKDNSIGENHQKINEDRHEQILSFYSNAKTFNVSLTDPIRTKEQILEYVSQYPGHNVVIAPMNNKLSTIGAGLAAMENSNIQLFYMQANIYNVEAYSLPGDDYHIFEY